MDVRDPLQTEARYQGNHMRLDVALAANKAQQPEVQTLRYGLFTGEKEVLDVVLERDEKRDLQNELLNKF